MKNKLIKKIFLAIFTVSLCLALTSAGCDTIAGPGRNPSSTPSSSTPSGSTPSGSSPSKPSKPSGGSPTKPSGGGGNPDVSPGIGFVRNEMDAVEGKK